MASRSGRHKAKTDAGRSKTVRAVKKKPVHEDPMSNIHVRLVEPRLVRKKLIATAIESIELIKRFDNYKDLQKQKDAVRTELGKIMKEIKLLVRQLKSSELPRLPEEKKAEKMQKTIQAEKGAEDLEKHEPAKARAKPAQKAYAPSREIGGIESELEELRRKLAEI